MRDLVFFRMPPFLLRIVMTARALVHSHAHDYDYDYDYTSASASASAYAYAYALRYRCQSGRTSLPVDLLLHANPPMYYSACASITRYCNSKKLYLVPFISCRKHLKSIK